MKRIIQVANRKTLRRGSSVPAVGWLLGAGFPFACVESGAEKTVISAGARTEVIHGSPSNLGKGSIA